MSSRKWKNVELVSEGARPLGAMVLKSLCEVHIGAHVAACGFKSIAVAFIAVVRRMVVEACLARSAFGVLEAPCLMVSHSLPLRCYSPARELASERFYCSWHLQCSLSLIAGVGILTHRLKAPCQPLITRRYLRSLYYVAALKNKKNPAR